MSIWTIASSRLETEKRRNGETGNQRGYFSLRFSHSPLRRFAASLPFGSCGFTLLEVLVAMTLLAVAFVSLLGLYNRSLTTAIRAQRLSTATLLAQELLTRSQLEGAAAARVTSGDFSMWHPDQYPEFRWRRTIRPTPLSDLWELHVSVFWGERPDESYELTLFTPLEGA